MCDERPHLHYNTDHNCQSHRAVCFPWAVKIMPLFPVFLPVFLSLHICRHALLKRQLCWHSCFFQSSKTHERFVMSDCGSVGWLLQSLWWMTLKHTDRGSSDFFLQHTSCCVRVVCVITLCAPEKSRSLFDSLTVTLTSCLLGVLICP